MEKNLLKDSIAALKMLRVELHNKPEASVIEELDKAIRYLETAVNDKDPVENIDIEILKLFGKALDRLPQILALFSLFE